MGYEVPDYCIFQVRWFDDNPDHLTYVRWTPWKNVEEWEYKDALRLIEMGENYQARILKQISIKGFGVTPDIDSEEYNPSVWINPGY
jgi:hypothetical protein